MGALWRSSNGLDFAVVIPAIIPRQRSWAGVAMSVVPGPRHSTVEHFRSGRTFVAVRHNRCTPRWQKGA